jgi:NAD(P)H-dependent flavin oxidoreductase YrpB (nitropropane dioxygenase family)
MSFDPAIETQVCKRFGIKYPVLQAGTRFVAHWELAAVVAGAGGIGSVGSGSMSSRELREQIRLCRAMSDRLFGVDILFAEVKADPKARR